MAVTAANVRVGKPLTTGGLLTAPLLTALPTDTTTALNAAFSAGGYLGDDGVVQTIDTDSNDIKAWGGDIVRTVQTSHKLTYAFTLIETASASLGTYYGAANVTGTSLITVKIVAGDLPHQEWVLEVRDGASKIRIAIPDGQVTDRGDVSYTDGDAVAYPCTITCYPDSSGVKAYMYCS